jgi:hypothetical protein
VDLDAGIADRADGDWQGEALQQRKVDVAIEPLRQEAGEAVGDGLEALADGVEVVQSLPEAEVGEVVEDQLVAQEGGEFFVLFQEGARLLADTRLIRRSCRRLRRTSAVFAPASCSRRIPLRVVRVNTHRAMPGRNVGHGRKKPLEPRGPFRNDKAKRNQPPCENSLTDGDTDKPGRTDHSVR